MTNQLTSIIAQKKREVADLQKFIHEQPLHKISQILRGKIQCRPSKSFKQALRQNFLAVIAEIKRKSPSKGKLASISDPVELANTYVLGGANAISILTDSVFFDGHLSDLTKVVTALHNQPHPVLRKDFIIDEIQLAESVSAGANAVLLIISVLGKNTKTLLEKAHNLGLEAIVEIHDRSELDIAIASDAKIIGINNRNLSSFEVNVNHALELVDTIPNDVIKIAESGITDPKIANDYYQAGFDAILIGETLVKTSDPASFIQRCRHV